MSFVDRVQVTLKAGDGGNGIVSFRREKFVDKGGPDGGDGGNGGDVILLASRNQNTLAAFRYQKLVKADNGKPGTERKRHGKSAEVLEVPVPVGTVVLSGEGQLLADLTRDGQRVVIAKGGKGGFGNAHFKSSTRQAPQVAEKGEKGQQIDGILELKMIADVGIVGLPNAGKSTLLSVISNAKPEIANYPFTTLTPNLGVVDIDKKNSLLFADIPGLIEGASHGKGLGDEFLRHVERTSVLVHLIDAYNENITTAYKTIHRELKDYKVDLSAKPQIVALTKTEGIDKKQIKKYINVLKKLVTTGTPVLAISSPSGEGVKELLRAIQKRAEAEKKKAVQKAQVADDLPVIGLRDDDESWQVVKSKDKFLVTGKKIERFAGRTDFNDYYGQQRLRDIMGKMGIIKELERQGIEPGQKIIIGHPEVGHIEY
ncbi:MAG: GTPase ObgE [bacterium]|nr:GTPase ObgE [bacterium]